MNIRATGTTYVGSSGFTNYSPSNEALAEGLAEVFKNNPGAIVIDGNDDWYAPKLMHPGMIADECKIKTLGAFHSGVSGFTWSGIIIEKKDLKKFIRMFNTLKLDDMWTIAREPNWRPYYRRTKMCQLKVYRIDSKAVLSAMCKINT